jgi:hypothetical protein
MGAIVGERQRIGDPTARERSGALAASGKEFLP